MRDISCNICGKNEAALIFESRDLLYRVTDKVFQVVRCENCGLVYLNPQPDMAEIATYYPDTYRPYKAGAQDFSYVFPKEPRKRVLDVGCGSGDLLIDIAHTHIDLALYGIDFDARAAKIAQSFGFHIFHGALREAHFENNFFDDIHMNHVLEHISNPVELLKECERIMKPGGKLFITIPNFGSLSRMIFKNKWYHLDAPRHLFHFTPRTLKNMLAKATYKNIEVTYIPSAKYFLQSYALWRFGKKQKFPKIVWQLLSLPAWIVAKLHLSSTMQVSAKK
jgi:SAM-dependent methyltransferase